MNDRTHPAEWKLQVVENEHVQQELAALDEKFIETPERVGKYAFIADGWVFVFIWPKMSNYPLTLWYSQSKGMPDDAFDFYMSGKKWCDEEVLKDINDAFAILDKKNSIAKQIEKEFVTSTVRNYIEGELDESENKSSNMIITDIETENFTFEVKIHVEFERVYSYYAQDEDEFSYGNWIHYDVDSAICWDADGIEYPIPEDVIYKFNEKYSK